MSHPVRVKNVKIVDNGLRSFVPPCFCFDLHAETEVIDTVSQIALPSSELLECGFSRANEGHFDPSNYHSGVIEHYEAGPRGEQGKRFVITETVQNY